MDYELYQRALDTIHENPEAFFQKARKIGANQSYVCPVCQNGTGKTKTGMTEIKKGSGRFKCQKCGFYGDAIDILCDVDGLSKGEAFKKACELVGINLDSSNYTYNTDDTHNTHNTHIRGFENPMKNEKSQDELEQEKQLELAIKNNILEAQKHLEETNYYTQRNISFDTARLFGLGFLKDWCSEKSNNKQYPSPRLIVPTSQTSYLARDVRENLTDVQSQYSKQKSGQVHLFNGRALLDPSKPCFICEGEFDAMSIVQLGHNAIGLGGVGNLDLLSKAIDKLKDDGKTIPPLIVQLDSDKAGLDKEKDFETELSQRGVKFLIRHIPESYEVKDANELLIKNEQELAMFLKDCEAEMMKDELEKLAKEKEAYIKANNTSSYLAKFKNDLASEVDTPYISTGFHELDFMLDGGLYEGLYILGAISSLGKTTFILQMADNIAKSGQDVLIFSLEMSRTELMAKSISRETALYCEKNHIPLTIEDKNGVKKDNAKNVRGITVKKFYKVYSQAEKDIIDEAIKNYEPITEHLFISEGVGDITVKAIADAVDKHIKITGNKPVVIVDYLQIIQAETNQNKTDKQLVDYNITALKRLSRKFKLSIVGISSFNRENYNQSASMTSFKESGSIEYSSDVLLGLQLKGIESQQDPKTFIEEQKAQSFREVELKILKNRNGLTGSRCDFKYYPKFNYFREIVKDDKVFKDTLYTMANEKYEQEQAQADDEFSNEILNSDIPF